MFGSLLLPLASIAEVDPALTRSMAFVTAASFIEVSAKRSSSREKTGSAMMVMSFVCVERGNGLRRSMAKIDADGSVITSWLLINSGLFSDNADCEAGAGRALKGIS